MAHKFSEPYSGKNPIPKVTTNLKSLVTPQKATEAKAQQLQSQTQSSQQDEEQDEEQTEKRAGQMEKGRRVRVRDPTTGEDVQIRNAPSEVTESEKGMNVLKLELPEPDWDAHRDAVLSAGLQSIRILAVTYALASLILFLPLPFLRRSVFSTIIRSALAFIPAGLTTAFLLNRLRDTALSSASARAWHSERIRGERAGSDVDGDGKIGADERLRESAEWANALVASIWPIMDPALFASLVDMLEDIMQGSVPSFVHSVRVSDLGLGSNPMRITSVRALPDVETEDALDMLDDEVRDQLGGDHVNLEVSFAYNALPSGQSAESKAHNAHLLIDFFLGLKGVWGFKVPVWAELRGVVGTARLRLQMIPDPPFVKTTMFTLMGLPRMSISVTALSHALPNVMNLPFISGFISSSLDTAAAEYVAPKSLILDMQRMIGGGDVSKDTQAVGVIVVHIHRATGIKKMDTTGSSADPYVTLTYSRLGKPLFSTRIIKNELNPNFEETAVLPVDVNVVKLKEQLSLQVWDSDRSSADDMMGSCEVDITSLLRSKNTAKRHITPLSTPSSSSHALGTLEYTVGYFSKRFPNTALRTDGRDPGVPDDIQLDGASTEQDGAMRTTLNGLERAVLVCPPDDVWVSGLVGVQVHEIRELGVGRGGRRGAEGHRGLAHEVKTKLAGGEEGEKGQDEEGEMEEGEGMPSSYCTISLNDEMVYETRVKPITSSPIFNAGTERFVRDWRAAHVSVAVKDSRMRENDAVLGVLSDLLVNASQLTRVYHLEHGIGHGRIRISLLFRPVSAQLPPQLLGFDIGTVRVHHIHADGHAEAEADLAKCDARLKLSTGGAEAKVARRPTRSAVDGGQIVWEREGVELPVMQRYGAALLLSFRASGVHAMAALWLRDLVDGVRAAVGVALFSSGEDAAFARLKQNYVPLDGDLSAWAGGDSEKGEGEVGLKRIGTVTVEVEFVPGIGDAHRDVMWREGGRGRWEEVEREAREGGREDVGEVQSGSESATHGAASGKGSEQEAQAQQRDGEHSSPHGANGNTEDAARGNDGQSGTHLSADGPNNFVRENSTTATTGHGEDERGSSQGADNSPAPGKKHRGPMKKFKEWKEKEKELHADHRGIMQMKGARTAVWVRDSMHDAAHSVKDKFKMEGRQPDVETEV
ncbi:hypothetical protein DENSPDRAFT_905439 [Dentipellis sp. KUC8613]|nr:hypothetical protein DENSPDRAFT_905439 [Dentipellis sp. KUC8613]